AVIVCTEQLRSARRLRRKFETCFALFAAMILPQPRSWMALLVNRLQTVKRQMCVNLRSGDIGVAQNGLHRSQVRAIAHHVRRTTVPQHVRAGVATSGG